MILVQMVGTTLIGCFGSARRLGHDDLIDAEDGNLCVHRQSHLPVLDQDMVVNLRLCGIN